MSPSQSSISSAVPGPRRWHIPSDPALIAAVRRGVETFAAAAGLDEKSAAEIGLCVNEALANVIRHAYDGAAGKRIFVKARATPDGLRIAIRDWGCGVDPTRQPRRSYDPLSPGGVGLICLRTLTDELRFRKQRCGMLLIMHKRRSKT